MYTLHPPPSPREGRQRSKQCGNVYSTPLDGTVQKVFISTISNVLQIMEELLKEWTAWTATLVQYKKCGVRFQMNLSLQGTVYYIKLEIVQYTLFVLSRPIKLNGLYRTVSTFRLSFCPNHTVYCTHFLYCPVQLSWMDSTALFRPFVSVYPSTQTILAWVAEVYIFRM